MGRSLRSMTANSADPEPKGHCNRQKCLMCLSTSGGSEGKCWINNITYSIECNKCWTENKVKVIYHGESSRSGYTRGLEHIEDLENNSDKSPIWEHCIESHNSHQLSLDNLKMKLTGTYKGPLRRQTAEGCQISQTIKDRENINNRHSETQKIKIFNSKNQFYQPGIVRTRVSKDEYE